MTRGDTRIGYVIGEVVDVSILGDHKHKRIGIVLTRELGNEYDNYVILVGLEKVRCYSYKTHLIPCRLALGTDNS